MQLEKSVQKYLEEKEVLGTLSNSSIKNRRYELLRFIAFCKKNGIDRPTRIDEDIILDYLKSLNTAKYTQITMLFTLSSYMNFLVKKQIINENYAAKIDKPKMNYPEADYLEFYEVKKLFSCETKTAPRKVKDRNILLLNLFFTLCLRASEAVELNFSDVKLELKQLWIKRKGGKIVKMPLNDELITQFNKWLLMRKEYKGHETNFVFLSSQGNRMTTRQARFVVSNAMRKAKIEKRKKGTHILRHSGATYRLKNGENIRIIQKMLGHKSLAVTEKYMHFNEVELRDMIDRSPKMNE